MKYLPSALLFALSLFTFATCLDFSNLSTWTKWGRETQLIIQNLRVSPVESVSVRDVDKHDFMEGNGPREKFKGVSIPAKRSIERTLEINNFATRCPFTMDLTFADGVTASLHINMKFGLGEGDAEFRYGGPFPMSYKRSGTFLIVALGP